MHARYVRSVHVHPGEATRGVPPRRDDLLPAQPVDDVPGPADVREAQRQEVVHDPRFVAVAERLEVERRVAIDEGEPRAQRVGWHHEDHADDEPLVRGLRVPVQVHDDLRHAHRDGDEREEPGPCQRRLVLEHGGEIASRRADFVFFPGTSRVATSKMRPRSARAPSFARRAANAAVARGRGLIRSRRERTSPARGARLCARVLRSRSRLWTRGGSATETKQLARSAGWLERPRGELAIGSPFSALVVPISDRVRSPAVVSEHDAPDRGDHVGRG